MLSKKYYKVFAELIGKELKGKADNYQDFKNKLIAFFKADNPRFNVNRFNKAIEEYWFSNMYGLPIETVRKKLKKDGFIC